VPVPLVTINPQKKAKTMDTHINYPVKVTDASFICDTVRIEINANTSVVFAHILQKLTNMITQKQDKHDGKYWVCGTYNSLAGKIKGITGSQVRTSISKLIQAGYLITGHFSHGEDRVIWYTLGPKGAEIYLRSDWEDYGTYFTVAKTTTMPDFTSVSVAATTNIHQSR